VPHSRQQLQIRQLVFKQITSIYSLSKSLEMIFKAADKKRIKISIDSAMIVFKLKTQGAIQDTRLIDHERD
jgi:hypothetical protein